MHELADNHQVYRLYACPTLSTASCMFPTPPPLPPDDVEPYVDLPGLHHENNRCVRSSTCGTICCVYIISWMIEPPGPGPLAWVDVLTAQPSWHLHVYMQLGYCSLFGHASRSRDVILGH